MKSDTRQRLIDITFEEIFTNGYQGASLSIILGKAGINKGSMYHFFKNKKEMALATVEEKLSDLVPDVEVPYLTNLFGSLREMGEMDLSRGCPFANLVQEMSNIDDDFHHKLSKIYRKYKAKFRATFDAAIEAKEMDPVDTEKLASVALMVFEGGMLGAKIAKDSGEYLLAIDALEGLVRGSRKRATPLKKKFL